MGSGLQEGEVFVAACGQYLDAGLGDQQGVLPLGGEAAVLGHRGPAVAEHLGAVVADVDHRLDGEAHAGGELDVRLGGVAVVVQHLGVLVEAGADAVAAEVPHHRVAAHLGVALDGPGQLGEARAGAHQGDAAVEALLGDAAEALALDDLADHEHHAGVAVVAVGGPHGDVQVHDVALLQLLAVVGDAVADHVVDGGAHRLGKAVVVQDRKSTRLNSSHVRISYAVFCLKKKKETTSQYYIYQNQQ